MSEWFGFEEALRRLKNPWPGCQERVRRKGWPISKLFLVLHGDKSFGCLVVSLRGELEPYTPSQNDLLVDDWYEVES